ncbi:hypothetical protein CLV88_1052 [Shimia abyssi]|uniref:Uncharacterized protein n=1 Tax=Shimia abyssi TaxID=1662395 RepID=A0A2P8FCY7_9RHOB|nr:hypothetical protein CLV88_1052 [Shimia abyssi]
MLGRARNDLIDIHSPDATDELKARRDAGASNTIAKQRPCLTAPLNLKVAAFLLHNEPRPNGKSGRRR